MISPQQEFLRKIYILAIFLLSVVAFVFFILGEFSVIDGLTQNIMFICIGCMFHILGVYQLTIHKKDERFYKSAALMFAIGLAFFVCYILLLIK